MDSLLNGHFDERTFRQRHFAKYAKNSEFLFNGYLTLKRGLSYCFDCQKTYIGPDIYAW